MSTGGFPYPRCSMYGQMFHVWHIKTCSWGFFRANVGKDSIQICIIFWVSYTYGHLSVITGYFSGIIHSINGVMLVRITGISGHNCRNHAKHGQVWRRPCILWRGIKKWPETRRRKPSWLYPCGTSLIEGHVFNTVFERNSCRYCMFMHSAWPSFDEMSTDCDVFSIFHVYQVFFIWLKKTLNFHVFPHVFSCIFCFPPSP